MDEIFIYGDIEPDGDNSAKVFVDKLKTFAGDVIVHVNSGGGDIFEAVAIYNAMKDYPGNVTVKIDGFAASAASLVVCGGDRVIMASNALIMIHLPVAWLGGYYTSADLNAKIVALTAIESSVVDIYQKKINNPQVDVLALMQNETWLTAKDALKWGFADEISGEADMELDDVEDVLTAGNVRVDMKNFDKVKLRKALGNVKLSHQTENPARIERERILSLMKLRGKNPNVNALLKLAIERGQSVDEIKPYLDCVQNCTPKTNFDAVIRDQMKSGAEGVIANQQAVDPVEAQRQLILKYANGGK